MHSGKSPQKITTCLVAEKLLTAVRLDVSLDLDFTAMWKGLRRT